MRELLSDLDFNPDEAGGGVEYLVARLSERLGITDGDESSEDE